MGFRRFVACGVLIACGACGQKDPAQAPPTGILVVSSQPPGASIQIDGRPRAVVTPDTLELPAGRHRVDVALEDYESHPAGSEIVIEAGAQASADFCLTLVQATVPRVVLVEHFGNVECEPCGPVEIALHEFQESHGAGQVLTLGYRTNFPSTRDPLFLENRNLHLGRMDYYVIWQAPTVLFDGGLRREGTVTSETLEELLEISLQNPPHFVIEVADTLSAPDYRVGATLIPLDCPLTGDLIVQFALLERVVQVSGDEVAHNAVRDLLPGASGEPFSAAYGETLCFRRSRTLDAGWDADQIETVVFVQSASTREILQTASTFGSTPIGR